MTEVFFRDYLKLSKKRVPFATAVVVKHDIPISGKSGDKAIILNDGSLLGWIGGGCTNPIVIEEGLSALNSGKSKLIVIDPENKSDNGPGEKHFQIIQIILFIELMKKMNWHTMQMPAMTLNINIHGVMMSLKV